MSKRGTLVGPDTFRLERLLPGPVERLWSYLTDSDKRATWLAAGEFELRVGGRIELKFDHAMLSDEKIAPEKWKDAEHARFEGKITRLEPMRVLAYTWESWELGEVTFELIPRGRDVLLVITHRGLEQRDGRISVASGWDAHTGVLADVLSGVKPRPFWTTLAELEKEYEALH
jgi:uncharacterized protein YndB with AHSA1/START domain